MKSTLSGRSAFVLLALVVSVVNVQSIVITSAQYTAGGNWTEEWWAAQDSATHQSAGSFGFSRSTPHTVAFESHPNKFNTAEVTFAPFALGLTADAAFWGFSGPDIVIGGGIDIGASSTTTFRPDSTHLVASLSVSSLFNYYADEQDLHFVLKDLTTSLVLADLPNLDDDIGLLRTFDLTVDPSHEYSVILTGGISAWDGKFARMNATVTFDSPIHAAIPDSIGTLPMLLLGLASMGMMGGWKRR